MPVKRVQLNVSDGDHVTVGDVIQCSANTINPPVSYYWQQYVNESWQQLQPGDDDDDDDGSGSMLRLSTVGVHVLRCVADNVVHNSTHNATSDNVTLYIVEPGKCSTAVRCVKHRRHRNKIVLLKNHSKQLCTHFAIDYFSV